MSGTFPQTPAPNELKIASIQPTRTSVTHSLKRQVRTSGAQRYRLQLGFAPLRRDQFAPISAFVESQAGQFETFQYVPIEGYTRGALTSPVTANGAFAKGDKTIALTGANAPLLAGDYIKFANHSKVYQVAADGQTSITLTTVLMADVPDLTALIYNAVPFTVALATDITEYTITPGKFYSFGVDLVEIY